MSNVHRPAPVMPSTVSAPVAPMDRFQQIWSSLSAADREVILGHSEEELSKEDHIRLAQVASELGKRSRAGKPIGYNR